MKGFGRWLWERKPYWLPPVILLGVLLIAAMVLWLLTGGHHDSPFQYTIF